jgi:hypothetical protein
LTEIFAHFCTAGNQPRFTSAGLVDGRIDFRLAGGSLPDESIGHIHSVGFVFRAPDRVDATWVWFAGGREENRLVRVQRRAQ